VSSAKKSAIAPVRPLADCLFLPDGPGMPVGVQPNGAGLLDVGQRLLSDPL
jgi:hypothetical protein